MVRVCDGSDFPGLSRSRVEATYCTFIKAKASQRFPTRLGRQSNHSSVSGLLNPETVLLPCATHRPLCASNVSISSTRVSRPFVAHSERGVSSASCRHRATASILLRDHRPRAGLKAFTKQRSKLHVTAGSDPGAVPQRSKPRGGLPFERSAPQATQPAQSDKTTGQQTANNRSLIRQQNPVLKKSARSQLTGADTCRICGGRGFQIIEEELQACSACNGENWAPSADLVQPLANLPRPPSPTQTGPASRANSAKPSLTPKGRDDSTAAEAAASSAGAALDENSDGRSGAVPGRGRTKRGARAKTEADREKISAAMKGRRWTDEHRKNISESMKGLWKSNTTRRSQVSASLTDRLKVCSYCGTVGHNRRGCPELHPEKQHTVRERPATTGSRGRPRKTGDPELDLEIQQERQRQRQRAKEAEALTKRTHACSYCGEVGHNKRGCPKLAREQQEEEDKRSKEQYGSLWGLPGVEEQRMPRGQQALLVFPVPFRIEDAVNQAAAAVVRAHTAGIRRQKIEVLLPQAGVTSSQGSWPGGVRQQAQVAIPSLIEPLLRQLKQEDTLQGRMTAEWLDETDCVGAWQNERLAAVVFATADTLSQVRHMARVKGPHRLMLLINPQWQTDGQIISDFGFGRARSDADKFLAALQDVYCLERVRVLGDDIRLLKCYPGDWQVHYTWPNGRGSLLMGVEPTRPSYARLVEMLKSVPNTRASRSWVDRVLDINNLKGDTTSPLTRGSYSEDVPADVQQPKATTAAVAASAAPKQKGPSLRQRLQDAFAEQQETAGEAAVPHPPLPTARSDSALSTPPPLWDAEDGGQGKNEGEAKATSGVSAAIAEDMPSRSTTSRNSDSVGGSNSKGASSGHSSSSGRIAVDGIDGADLSTQTDSAAKLRDLSSKAADGTKGNRPGEVATEVGSPVTAVNRSAETQSLVSKADGTQQNTALSSRSIDGDDDGMLDRFGSVDIITGKPVRDLKLDPVLQLMKWRESLFGSRDSVSESLDRDDTTD